MVCASLGSGSVNANGGKGPGAVLGAATFLATKNPAGLIISGGMKSCMERKAVAAS